MMSRCERCRRRYDDAECSTICPHKLIMPRYLLEQKELALTLLGREVTFNHTPNGPFRRVDSVGWDGMVTIEGFVGSFAPHLFTVKP